ncbi:Flp family type IVb pilin [Methylobacterium sp. CM6241]
MTISEKNDVTTTVAKPISSSDGPSSRFTRIALRFALDTSGTSAIEYTLVAGLIFLVIVAALRNYADRVHELYEFIGQAVARST